MKKTESKNRKKLKNKGNYLKKLEKLEKRLLEIERKLNDISPELS